MQKKKVSQKGQKSKRRQYDYRGFDWNHIHRNGTKYDDFGYDFYGYDAEGFNKQGYNKNGRNRSGKYDRYNDTTSNAEEGFSNPFDAPVALTDHAQKRFVERLGITDYATMRARTVSAYRYGKSKRQIKKTSAHLVEEIEQKYDNSVVLVYKNYIYVFTCENALKTVFKNERIPL